MKLTAFFLVVAATSSGVIASPIIERQTGLCTTTTNTPLCCDVDVLGVADLNCEPPPTTPTDVQDFVNICAAIGKISSCCLLPILGQALICAAVNP